MKYEEYEDIDLRIDVGSAIYVGDWGYIYGSPSPFEGLAHWHDFVWRKIIKHECSDCKEAIPPGIELLLKMTMAKR